MIATIFGKHLLYLSLIFMAVPLASRILINRINRRAGIAAVPIDVPYLLQAIVLGFLFALAAEGGFEFMRSWGMRENIARLISLGLVGGMYGWFFGIQEYVHTYAAIFLGIAGGLCTAALYILLPFDPMTQAVFAAVLTVLPLLSIDFPEGPIGRTLRAGMGVLPIKGYLR
jgi:hypothetical protein